MFARSARRLSSAIAFLLALLPAIAAAQTFPTLPSGTVIGRTAIGTGPSQAIPISTLIASMLNPLTVTSVNTASVVYRGATSGMATVSAQSVAGTPTIQWPTTSGTVATNATAPVVLNSTTGNISCPTCLTASTSNVFASRADAAAANLSGITAIQTLGYAAAGDGGGATFVKINPAIGIVDTNVTSLTITNNGGSRCTNGT